jgi:hypothetical protein
LPKPCSAVVLGCGFKHRPGARSFGSANKHWRRVAARTRRRGRLRFVTLPINPLIRHQNPTENAQVAYEIANLIRCFAP